MIKQAPSFFRFRKNHKPKAFFLKALEKKMFYPSYGTFALKSKANGKLTFKQIEAGRRSIRRTLAKTGIVFIRIFTYASITKRSVGMRMGKGKGAHFIWVCPIKKGQIIYEILNVSPLRAWFALRKAADKMPFPSRIAKLTY